MYEWLIWLLVITSGSYIVSKIINFGVNIDTTDTKYKVLELEKFDYYVIYVLIAMGWITIALVILFSIYLSIRYR